jgi:diguanylate cyclase (GGDEF)-like protein
MVQNLSTLAQMVESDLRALLQANGDACLWLDSHDVIRRELGTWPRGASAPTDLTGRRLAELLSPSLVAALRDQRRAVASLNGLRWRSQADGAGRDYLLRSASLDANRWLLVAREITLPANDVLENECARLRVRITQLEQRLQTVSNEQAMFATRLKEEVGRAARRAEPVSVVRLELHDLTSYGQRFGTEASLQVAGTVDQTLRRDARAGDFVARWDACGFAMLLPNTDRISARLVAERHQRGVGAISWPHAEIDVRVGLATLWRDANDPEELLQKSQPVH